MGCTASRYQPSSSSSSSCTTPPPPPPPPPPPIPTTATVTGRTIPSPVPFHPRVVVHHPAIHKGDSHHLVSLTSSTYGYSHLIPLDSPRSPSPSPPSPPSPTTVIDAWELMDGLDDPVTAKKPSFYKSNTFHHRQDHSSPPAKEPHKKNNPPAPATGAKPLWKHLSEEALLADMDPSVAAALRRSNSSKKAKSQLPPVPAAAKIVLYTTSLRGIRRTYEDCCAVRNILRGFWVAVDERDVSMDSSYRRELQGLLAGKSPITLPQLFVKGRWVGGGVEEVRQMHETGELGRLLEDVPRQDPCFMCQSCGNARFIPCRNCNGSRKVFEEEEMQLKRCSECNENGLVRCPDCC